MAFVPAITAPSVAAASRRVWFPVHSKGIVVRRDDASAPAEKGAEKGAGRGANAVLLGDDELAALGVDVASPELGRHYLGRLDDADAFAVHVDRKVEVAPPLTIAGLRDLYGLLGEERFGVAGRATQIIDWASNHRFCGRCATPTELSKTERCLVCPSCTLSVYPRISPAIIVLIRRGDEALLARGARFPLPFYSTLAGFAEVGESLEETLAREVREEVGIEVKAIRYFGSQPWPFPNSLMVGFFAEWAGGDIRIDEKEILDAQWFRADALPTIPPRISIARRLIDAWLDDVAR